MCMWRALPGEEGADGEQLLCGDVAAAAAVQAPHQRLVLGKQRLRPAPPGHHNESICLCCYLNFFLTENFDKRAHIPNGRLYYLYIMTVHTTQNSKKKRVIDFGFNVRYT